MDSVRGTLLRLGEARRARHAYEQALQYDSGRIMPRLGMASALMMSGELSKAQRELEYCYRKDPEDPRVLGAYGKVLRSRSEWEEAVEVYSRLKDIPGFHDQALLERAFTYIKLSLPGPALRDLDALGAVGVRSARALTLKGKALAIQGFRDHALREYRNAIKADARYVTAWVYLAREQSDALSDSEIEFLRRLASRSQGEDRAALSFALAWAMEERCEFKRAFAWLVKGNSIMRRELDYDRTLELRQEKGVMRCFDREFMEAGREWACVETAPIFLVGMPRSGTTWLEKVLEQHSAITATGENRALSRALSSIGLSGWTRDVEKAFTGGAETVLPALVENYRAYNREMHGITAELFTDTTRISYYMVGMLASIFPRAKFIYVRRDPMDICVDCFRKFFGTAHPYTYHLDDCAFRLSVVDRLSRHWMELVDDRMIEISYERLVGDYAGTVRGLISFLGLEWEDGLWALYNHSADSGGTTGLLQPGWSGLWRWYGEAFTPLRQRLEAYGVADTE